MNETDISPSGTNGEHFAKNNGQGIFTLYRTGICYEMQRSEDIIFLLASPAMEATDTIAIAGSYPLVKRMFGANNKECGAVLQ